MNLEFREHFLSTSPAIRTNEVINFRCPYDECNKKLSMRLTSMVIVVGCPWCHRSISYDPATGIFRRHL